MTVFICEIQLNFTLKNKVFRRPFWFAKEPFGDQFLKEKRNSSYEEQLKG